MIRNLLIVVFGSGIGGGARYLLNNFVGKIMGTSFPWGILLINVIGSTAIGVIAGIFAYLDQPHSGLRLFLTAGICGGFTTFSAFSLDFATLYERGDMGLAFVYVLASVVVSIGGLFLGLAMVRMATA
jgi:CrcB protein